MTIRPDIRVGTQAICPDTFLAGIQFKKLIINYTLVEDIIYNFPWLS